MALTLEQVLARSLRLPSKRVNKALFQPSPKATVGQSSDPQSMLDLMQRVELADKLRIKDRPHFPKPPPHGGLIRNSQDLLSNLNTAKRMGSWEDALRTFEQGKQVGSFAPNISHLRVVADILCKAKQVAALSTLLRDSANGSVEDRRTTLAHVTPALCTALVGWELSLKFVQDMPHNVRSTDAYNQCIAMCAQQGNWAACLDIVRSMGPNVMQDEPARLAASAAELPSPDAVSFAALVSVLQETNQKELAMDVLMKLPPSMREVILTSTVALIHVWSEQRSKRGGPPNA